MKQDRRRGLIAFALGAGVVVVLTLAAIWQWSPLREQIDPSHVAAWIGAIRDSPFAPLMLVLLYLGASSPLIPNSVLNAATILSLGSIMGLCGALAGSMISALAFYALGRRFGTKHLRRLAPHQLERLQRSMEHGGTLKVASIRMVPSAPFSVVNVVAGSIRVRTLPFTAGTFLGLLPGNLMLAAFGHQLRAALRSPAPRDMALLAAIVVIAALGGWWLHRRAMDS